MKDFYRRFKSKLKKLVKNDPFERQLLKAAKLPRYTKGEIDWSGRSFKFIDSNSFTWIYDEVFKRHIYRFESDVESPVIIDCGANIGVSIIYFKKLYPKAKVTAFEPDNQVFDYLNFNVKSFNLEDVKLINKGLWKEETELVFFSEGADANRIMSDNEKLIKDNNQYHKTTIKTVKLSEYIRESVDFLKIDIEGAETDVILEAKDKLHLVRNIFIEYHSFVDRPQTLNEILDVLSETGFRYYMDIPVSLTNQPFVHRGSFLSMDLLVNIYAYRTSH
jgi:FkbM family methyltransferase